MRKFNRDSGKRPSGRSSGRSTGRDSSRSGGRSSGRSSFDKFNKRDRSSFEKQMHEVTCDKCGQSCEVPFKPTGGKPVYCSDCFRKEDGSESRSSHERPGRDRPRHERSESRQGSDSEFQQINAKLDKILEMLNND